MKTALRLLWQMLQDEWQRQHAETAIETHRRLYRTSLEQTQFWADRGERELATRALDLVEYHGDWLEAHGESPVGYTHGYSDESEWVTHE